MANLANSQPKFAAPHPEISQLAKLVFSHSLRESVIDAPAPDPLASVRQTAKDAANDPDPKDWRL